MTAFEMVCCLFSKFICPDPRVLRYSHLQDKLIEKWDERSRPDEPLLGAVGWLGKNA